jgi:hypothetical protein
MTRKPTKKKRAHAQQPRYANPEVFARDRAANTAPMPEVPSECEYRPWWSGKRRRSRRPTAFDLYASAALTGLLVRESAETTLSELVEGALHLATLLEAAREEQGK